jgi:hypothetical protein
MGHKSYGDISEEKGQTTVLFLAIRLKMPAPPAPIIGGGPHGHGTFSAYYANVSNVQGQPHR